MILKQYSQMQTFLFFNDIFHTEMIFSKMNQNQGVSVFSRVDYEIY